MTVERVILQTVEADKENEELFRVLSLPNIVAAKAEPISVIWRDYLKKMLSFQFF